jgi:hypothetical protein
MASKKTLTSSRRRRPLHLGQENENGQSDTIDVLSRAGRYRKSHPDGASHDPFLLKAKEASVEGRRYIVCLMNDRS